MTAERQIAANRANAQKSTGSRTAQGKAISSRNNARHGLYASAPVIPRLESVTAWDYHRVTTVQSLAPANAIEDALAERIALLLWRLGRVARYEQAVANHAQHDAPADVASEYEDADLHVDQIRTRFAAARRRLRAFERFRQLRPEAPMTGLEAASILDTVGSQLPDFDYAAFEMPGLFHAEDRMIDIPGWTAARVRQVLDAIAQATGRDADNLVQAAAAAALRDCNQARTPHRHLARRLDDLRHQRVLPQSADLRSVARYEAHLGRQLNQTLTQLRLHQRHREAGHSRPAYNDYHVDLADDPDPAPPQATHW